MDFDLKIALRDSKIATRPYLIVNPLLAKHLPVKPSISLEYFDKLGKKVADVCRNENVLVIGFAETATAVGAAVAASINNSVYVHTTRETLDLGQNDLIVDFLEEHSHAKNQSLYLSGNFKKLSQFDRIIFVEDEITTGKTILNFLKNIAYSGKITISALVFNNFDKKVFKDYDVSFCYLQKIGYVHQIFVEGLSDTRIGVNASKYQIECKRLAAKIIKAICPDDLQGKNILVIGTEEFMYPVLIFGSEIEKITKSVVSHSTTRSPILPDVDLEYPIHSRCEFKSVYSSERTTYLYNLKKYDTVIVVTNSKIDECEELKKNLQNSGNQVIYFVRVRDV